MLSICIYLELHIYGIPACSTSSSQPVRSEQKDTLQMKMETEAWWWNEGSFASPKSIHEKKQGKFIAKGYEYDVHQEKHISYHIYTHYNMQHHMYIYIYMQTCLLNRQANEAQRLQDKQLGLTQPGGSPWEYPTNWGSQIGVIQQKAGTKFGLV